MYHPFVQEILLNRERKRVRTHLKVFEPLNFGGNKLSTQYQSKMVYFLEDTIILQNFLKWKIWDVALKLLT